MGPKRVRQYKEIPVILTHREHSGGWTDPSRGSDNKARNPETDLDVMGEPDYGYIRFACTGH